MPQSAPPRLITGDLPAIEDHLSEMILEIQDGQPLAPVTILVENTMLIPYLRRRLAFYNHGHINLHIMTITGLADRLGRANLLAHYGDGDVEPMPRFGDRVLSRRVAEETPTTYFQSVSHSPGFAETLRGLFRDLARAGIRPSDWRRASASAPQNGTSKFADIANLYERYEAGRTGYFSPTDLYHYVDLNRVAGEHVLVYGVWELSGIQKRFFHKMFDAGIRLTFFLPSTGTDADEAHTDLRAWLARFGAEDHQLPESLVDEDSLSHLQRRLFSHPEERAPGDGHVRLLSAPDPPREVREAARACLKWAEEGIPFYRMAVVYRQTDRYRGLIDQIFRRAGISTYLSSGRPLIEQPTGQRLMSLLNLVDADLSRSALMEFLTETILPERTRNEFGDDRVPIQPARWDQISREAGVIEGRDQWLSRLDRLYSNRLAFVDEDEDEDVSERQQEEAWEIARLRRFIETFADDLSRVQFRASWSNHLAFLRRIGVRYIDGADVVLDTLGMIEQLDRLDEEVTFDRFRDLVRFWLARQDGSELLNDELVNGLPTGEFDRFGVNVLDVGSLRHLCFDAVIILGVAERQFPPPPRQDPLLLDRERSRFNEAEGWSLPLKAQRADDEALTFALAVQSANKRLQISFARNEAGSARSYLPSHFFREAAAALTGEAIEASQIDRLPKPLYERVPAGTFWIPEGYPALDDHEYDRLLLEQDPDLGVEICRDERDTVPRALAAAEARRGPQLTRYDGLIDPEVASPISWTAGLRRRAISPSRLETYATCPYQFFLRYGLRLEPADEPELLERIGALDRGSLIHSILEQFLTKLGPDDPPSVERREEHLETLFEIAGELCSRLEEQGLVGYRLLWEYDRIEMFEDLEEWYEHEIEAQQADYLQPTTFELRFGPAWTPGEGGAGSRDEPYTLRVDQNELSFQGRVDRVDISPDRSRFRVIDYKTGKSGPRYQENTLSGGRALQLPIYLLASSELLGIPWQRSVAEYFFPTRRGDFKRVEMTGEWMREHWDEFAGLLGSLSDAIESGLFLQLPEVEKPYQHNCRVCDFESICTANVRSIARRKRSDPRAAEFRRLVEADGEQ